jgi:2'-5' RNA ligase
MAFRAFVSLDIGDRIDWHALRTELRQVDKGIRTVKPELLHLTLRFLGDTDEGLVEAIGGVMQDAVAGVAPFRMAFSGVGVFPNAKRPRVVWIGLMGAEPLVEISRRVERGIVDLGFPREKRSFKPHATVARVKRLSHHERLRSLLDRWSDREFGAMEVRGITLKRSVLTPQGPIYTTMLETPLSGED